MKPLVSFAAKVGRVLAAWTLLLLFEHAAIAILHSRELAGGWELGVARTFVTPIVLAMLAPAAIVVAAVMPFASSRRAAGILAALFGAAVGYGVTFGRHFVNWGVRAPFIALVAIVGAAAVVTVHSVAIRTSVGRRIVGAVAIALGLWAIDSTVLPRLYPAFHAGLFVLTLASLAVAALASFSPLSNSPRREHAFAVFALVATASVSLVPWASTHVRSADNLRLILVEHAPLMGRAVLLAAKVSPPPPIDEDSTVNAALRIDPERALDWTGRDIVLITIDALRADHLSSYGYPRKTTPNIDALAANGARFTNAYCATPHTSYSVTSLLTGKYMRPLLSAGVGEDSETWASYLRRYGYRTAAFYPPAVFFIDEQKFKSFQSRGLDFEYRKEEFADPKLRSSQVRTYISNVPKGLPLFLWVHVFEPHEPYVKHLEHPFGDPAHPTDIDAYDSEIAASDALVGEVVAEVRKSRPSTVFIVSADHGEEFGDHGGRYHGTTVYEEQVRVPLIIQGEGIASQTIERTVQTIDLLATTLSALGIPRPPRVLGRDLGPSLARAVNVNEAPQTTGGFAYAETDDYSLLAENNERLICQRKIGACALYDVLSDRAEKKDIALAKPERVKALRTLLAQTERENGKFEKGAVLPEAIRRAFNRERDAEADVAALLDDANPTIRRKAAEGVLRLMVPGADYSAMAQVERACGREEDAETRTWCSLALVRNWKKSASPAERNAWLHDADPRLADAAALVFAERGDSSAIDPLIVAWQRGPHDFDETRDYLKAFEKIRSKAFIPVVLPLLDDVRLRPYAFETLASIGDVSVKPRLVALFASERYVTSREREARALIALGASAELGEPLTRFAGMPEPFDGVVDAAIRAKVLRASSSRGALFSEPTVEASLMLDQAPGFYRVLARTTDATAEVEVATDGERPLALTGSGREKSALVDFKKGPHKVAFVAKSAKIEAIWVVPAVPEMAAPPPKAWDAGVTDPRGIEGRKESP